MAASTRFVACSGSTRPARLAQELARHLHAHAERVDATERFVAIDGCTSRCASRMLAARGVQAGAIGLHELGVHSDTTSGPARPHAVGVDTRRVHTTDDYLYAIHALTTPVVACGALVEEAPTIAAHVAASLSVSRATAGQMIDRLHDAGAVERGPRGAILLTSTGRIDAARVVRAHRLAERLLTDHLGCSAAESYELALRIRSALDEPLLDRLAARLAPPARCPHGWPLDPNEPPGELIALSGLTPGSRAAVVALVERGDLLERLDELGLYPGAHVEVLDARSAGATVVVGGARRFLTRDEAAAVLIAP